MTLTQDELRTRQRLMEAIRAMTQVMDAYYLQRVDDLHVGDVPIDIFLRYYRQLVTLQRAILEVTDRSQLNDFTNPIWINARETYYWCLQFIRNGGRAASRWTRADRKRYEDILRKAGLL